jgi:putative inorganic carbon (hco3(-)) transporter
MALTGRIRPLNPWLLACLAVCIAIGVLAGMNPEYGLIGALGLMFAVVTVMDLTLGFVLFTAAAFLDVLSSSGSFTGTKVIGVVLFASWAARAATRRVAPEVGSFARQNRMLVVALVALLGWCALSFAWAYSPSTALGGAERYLLNILLIPIAFAAIRERRHVGWVLAAYAAGAALSAVYGFVHPGAQGAGRLTGAVGDPNAQATVLAAGLPLLIGLAVVYRHSSWMKLVAVVGVVVMFIGLVTTLSREGLVALGAVLVAAVIFGGRWRGRAAAVLLIGIVATAGYYSVVAPLSARQRVTMASTSGRSSLWTVALRVFEAHPVLGVGQDNFILVESRYLNQPGAIQALFFITTPKVAHNTYLEALADLGVPGLLTLLGALVVSLATAVKATWIFERLGDRDMELMSRAVVLALVAVFVANFFVTDPYARYLWLLLALCPVLLRLARRGAEQVNAS